MLSYIQHTPEVIVLVLTLVIATGFGIYYTSKLKASNALWKFALEGAGDGVWDWDITNDTAVFSDQYKAMFGFNDTDIESNMEKWQKRIHPDDLESMTKAINDYLTGQTEKYLHEHRVICKDNSIKWVLSRGMVVKRGKNKQAIRMVGTHTDITERKLLVQQLKNLAHYDSLTNLPNRTLLNDRLKLALAHAKREKNMLAIMFVDLDHFKEINDVYSHKIGDKVLKKIAQRLTGCVRESDTVARLGGDEFIILLSTVDSELDASLVARKIMAAVIKPMEIIKPRAIGRPSELTNKNLHVSASIGIAIYPKHGQDEQLLIINADLAMYQAKKCGKNQAKVFDYTYAEQQVTL